MANPIYNHTLGPIDLSEEYFPLSGQVLTGSKEPIPIESYSLATAQAQRFAVSTIKEHVRHPLIVADFGAGDGSFSTELANSLPVAPERTLWIDIDRAIMEENRLANSHAHSIQVLPSDLETDHWLDFVEPRTISYALISRLFHYLQPASYARILYNLLSRTLTLDGIILAVEVVDCYGNSAMSKQAAYEIQGIYQYCASLTKPTSVLLTVLIRLPSEGNVLPFQFLVTQSSLS